MIPYRTRGFLRRFGILLLVVAIVAVAVLICWLAWLDRYVVYTRDRGAVLDFSQSSQTLTGQTAVKPPEKDPVEIFTYEGSQEEIDDKKLARLGGYYITGKDLENDLEAVKAQLEILPENTPVMMDVKSIYGNFFYSSAVSEHRNSDLDIAVMDELIAQLNSGKFYTIARLPALRDRQYGLTHVNDGLPVAAGYLWMDDYGCYWLNPAKDGTITYLVSITNDLRDLGFDEVMFTDFRFPETDQLDYSGDKAAAIKTAAENLVSKCAGDTFAVSFLASDSTVQAVDGRSRLYLKGVDAADAAAAAAQYSMEDPAVGIVFLTESHDTRYEAFGALRPITSFVDHE